MHDIESSCDGGDSLLDLSSCLRFAREGRLPRYEFVTWCFGLAYDRYQRK
jgi:hypothetical protein